MSERVILNKTFSAPVTLAISSTLHELPSGGSASGIPSAMAQRRAAFWAG